uniref:Uncharacterized protein n=1 Tax=Bombyx mori TaxID=7091 RepID=A0A8R2HMM1_BOMMO|nr:uncharacterized protein LOC110385151 [Bombyx mori]
MSKRRLDWKESLKPDVTVGKKRGKINILKDETYKNENGKLTLVSSIKTKKTSTQTNTISMIRYALSQCKNIKTIQINYLIPGHTYMPVDSVHATIETKIRKCIVWAPSQWPTIMELARLDPEPYKVEVLNGKDFIGFDVNSTFNKKQKLSISKLSIATFKNQEPNLMYIKNSMLPDAETITIPLSPLKNTNCLKDMLYPTALGISAKKYKDLTSLVNKNIIPSRFAAEYKNLKVSITAKDYLMDTDEEEIQEIDSAN